jgi:hypothetical protein
MLQEYPEVNARVAARRLENEQTPVLAAGVSACSHVAKLNTERCQAGTGGCRERVSRGTIWSLRLLPRA